MEFDAIYSLIHICNINDSTYEMRIQQLKVSEHFHFCSTQFVQRLMCWNKYSSETHTIMRFVLCILFRLYKIYHKKNLCNCCHISCIKILRIHTIFQYQKKTYESRLRKPITYNINIVFVYLLNSFIHRFLYVWLLAVCCCCFFLISRYKIFFEFCFYSYK